MPLSVRGCLSRFGNAAPPAQGETEQETLCSTCYNDHTQELSFALFEAITSYLMEAAL